MRTLSAFLFVSLLIGAVPLAHAQIVSTNAAAPISLYYEQKMSARTGLVVGAAVGHMADKADAINVANSDGRYESPTLFSKGSITAAYNVYMSKKPELRNELLGFYVGLYSRLSYVEYKDCNYVHHGGWFGFDGWEPNGQRGAYLHTAVGLNVGYGMPIKSKIRAVLGMGFGLSTLVQNVRYAPVEPAPKLPYDARFIASLCYRIKPLHTF